MAKKIPAFSYTGAYRTQSDGRYWYILLLTSGTLTFQYAKSGVDVGCVGGGGSSACHLQTANTAGGSGGGAGGKGGMPGTDGENGTAGAANTGGGAGGPGGGYVDEDSRYNSKGGQAAAGGSGIVILRGTQDDLIPVVFNGTQLSELYFNGVKVTSLIYNGARLFIREVKRCFAHQAVKLC